MPNRDLFGVAQFLKEYPGMSIQPFQGQDVVLKGVFAFTANTPTGPEITDYYSLEISIPKKFPNALPIVREINGKIPRDGNYHINPDDTLCLGSPLRVLKKINENSDLSGFARGCLVPYLYAVSYKLINGGDLYFGELAHGKQGIIDDYRDLLGLRTEEQVMEALRLLGTKKKIANKKPCPCNCGNRLGRCSFRHKLNNFRNLASGSWFRNEVKNILMQQ
jgi:hypothetical protein